MFVGTTQFTRVSPVSSDVPSDSSCSVLDSDRSLGTSGTSTADLLPLCSSRPGFPASGSSLPSDADTTTEVWSGISLILSIDSNRSSDSSCSVLDSDQSLSTSGTSTADLLPLCSPKPDFTVFELTFLSG